MEGLLGVGLFFGFSVGVLAKDGALGVDAEPAAAGALEEVGEDALFVHLLARSKLVVQDIGAVDDRDIAQHAHGDYPLFEVEGLVLAGNELGQLLVAGSDFAGGGDVNKYGRENQFQAVLVALVDGAGPAVFNFLELANLRAFS